MRILHLSDLHFTSQSLSQDIVLSSLSKKITEISKEAPPDTLMITGDIAYSGKKTEYARATEFVESIVNNCSIDSTRVFIIPGNHDVDRSLIEKSHVKWWYEFKSEEDVNDNLSSDLAFPVIISKIEAYAQFSKKWHNVQVGKYGEYIVSIPVEKSQYCVKVIGLNSALFCGYDGDENQKLALGLDQVHQCDQRIETEKDIIITCIHHPFSCFHPCDNVSLNTVKRFSDLVLSGHVHDAKNHLESDGNGGETIFITAGSSFERRTSENSFNIIDIDLEKLAGTVTTYKYVSDSHTWILDRNLNHTEPDGVFKFHIKKQQVLPTQAGQVGGKTVKKYNAVLDLKYTELNRDTIDTILLHLQRIAGDTNINLTKIESGSVKIVFETNGLIPDSFNQMVDFGDRSAKLTISKTDVDEGGKPDISVYHWRTFLSKEFINSLQNPGATFSHSRVDDLKLSDLYVSPNLRVVNPEEKEKVDRVFNSQDVLMKAVGETIKIIIYGDDSSGKSTLVRWWFDKYYEQGNIPILISGSDIKDISLKKIKRFVQREYQKQYLNKATESLDDFDQDRIILIIDDFHRIRFTNPKYKSNLIYNIIKGYKNVILTGNEMMKFERYNSANQITRNILEDFTRYQILEFGPTLRYELIRKWNSLGDESLEQNDMIRLNKEMEDHIDSIIGRNFVPSYPIYLLTILQAKEVNAQKPEFSIHGFYYELLINDSLSKAITNKDDISLYYNYITDYCYFLFSERIRFSTLQQSSFEKFHSNYCSEYNVKIGIDLVLQTLEKSKLIKSNEDGIVISYKYVYYFFVARYLAINISQENERKVIQSLCQRVYRDEFASIVMFLTHLSKDQFVVNQLLENSRSLFSNFEPIKLESDVSFINDMILQLPQHVYEPLDVQKVKEEELREQENLQLQELEFDPQRDVYEYDINEDISSLDALSNMIRSMKTIEIVGQVTKKYWGELKAQQKYDLAEETYKLGLRTLGFHFSLLQRDTGMLVEYLKYIYRKRHPNRTLSKSDIEKASVNFLFSICVLSSFGIIKRITNAVGSDKLTGTFEQLLHDNNYTSIKLIDTSIKLDFNKSFPWDEIRDLKKFTDSHFLSNSVLKNLVINYLYVFHTTVEEKQKICSLLDIKMDQLRLIDATSEVKKVGPKHKLK